MESSRLAAGCAGAESRVLVITHHLLLENLAHAQKFSSFFTHQYFINLRAPSPGGSCGVRNHWVVWRVLPWHPSPPTQHPPLLGHGVSVPDKDRWDLALPFTPLNAGDLS